MPNLVNREKLLLQLESVQAGLSPREIIEQSSCFVFRDGRVLTYNDEVACRRKCELQITGAVPAVPLLSILRKLAEETLEVEVEGNELILIGKRRKAGIRLEAEITLPVGKVEKPGEWQVLHDDFIEGVNLVQHHASKDESQFSLTCIHLSTDYIESCNNVQAVRVKMKTGLKASTLVRRDALKHVVPLGMVEFCETESWMHFRNTDGLTLSVRRYMTEYENVDSIFQVKGEPIVIPKGLGEAVEKASIFSAESSDDNLISVELRPERMRIRGTGATGWFQEVKKLAYNGPDLSFLIAPEMLIEITNKHNEAEITEGRLKVDGGKWVFVTCLAPVAAEPGEKVPEDEDEPKKDDKPKKEKKSSKKDE